LFCGRFVPRLQGFLAPGFDLLGVVNPATATIEAVEILHGLVLEVVNIRPEQWRYRVVGEQ
jgi:hypothetical protein